MEWKTANPDRYELLKTFAKENRQFMTEAERALWMRLRGNALGHKFLRQHIIGDYIVDFLCRDAQVVIEVDGGYHKERHFLYKYPHSYFLMPNKSLPTQEGMEGLNKSLPMQGGLEGLNKSLPMQGGMEGLNKSLPTQGGMEGLNKSLPMQGGMDGLNKSLPMQGGMEGLIRDQVEEDRIRQDWLESAGYKVIRFTNEQILHNNDYALTVIKTTIDERYNRTS